MTTLLPNITTFEDDGPFKSEWDRLFGTPDESEEAQCYGFGEDPPAYDPALMLHKLGPLSSACGSVAELFADVPVVCEPYDNGFDPKLFIWEDPCG